MLHKVMEVSRLLFPYISPSPPLSPGPLVYCPTKHSFLKKNYFNIFCNGVKEGKEKDKQHITHVQNPKYDTNQLISKIQRLRRREQASRSLEDKGQGRGKPGAWNL